MSDKNQLASAPLVHHSGDLVALFNKLFLQAENTRLCGGASEPMYVPAKAQAPARVCFTQDYFASALHEVAHWCLAGAQRRQQQDYGYWYISERDTAQQALFERCEARPQALESLFSELCGFTYRPSYDRLSEPEYHSETFLAALARERRRLLASMPAPAALFARALHATYSQAPHSVLAIF